MSDLKETFRKGWLEEDPRITAAALLGILTFIILNIFLYKSEKRKNILKQQAIENHTVIEAKIVSRTHYSDSDSDTEYHGTYQYTIHGKTRQYSIYCSLPAPDTISLYPKNRSMTKFFSDYDRTANAGIGFNGLAAIAVIILTLWATGYIF